MECMFSCASRRLSSHESAGEGRVSASSTDGSLQREQGQCHTKVSQSSERAEQRERIENLSLLYLFKNPRTPHNPQNVHINKWLPKMGSPR
eukprot:768715-Amphidinium_carterae.1